MMRLTMLLTAVLGLSVGQEPGALVREQPLARTWFVVVSGVSGEKRFADSFAQWGTLLVNAAGARFGIPDSMTYYLAEDSTRDARRIRGRSSKATIEATLQRIVATAREGDRLFVVLLGHGSAQGQEVRFNLPGPDMTPGDFARILGPSLATIAFINTASASGDFVKALSGPRRVVITATRSAREQNETFFPGHFVRALTSDAGDTDKDGRVSLLEAFTFARREVEKRFESSGLLATEHPLLDDDGDGTGHADAGDKGPDGRLARSMHLAPLGGAALAADPRAAPLVAKRSAIEARIDALRGRRTEMTEDAYQKALEPLLVELAETTRAIRALEPRKP
ncbi:MAG: hypothetical protein IT361_12670 [Gemmatimonadaceae bacterium]|nr:hypothetical protein [Gemmatimonadaceae bacterium]